MKQEVYRPSFLRISRFLSEVLHPVWRLFSHHPYNVPIDKKSIQSILVTEYHCIGDVILIIPALKALKEEFPKAKIILVTNNAAEELAKKITDADEIISYSAPWVKGWTSVTNWKGTLAVIIKLRNRKLDLGIDFKGDIRNLFLLRGISPKHRFGFTATGGKYLLTHPQNFPFNKHQVDRALFLLKSVRVSPQTSQFNEDKKRVQYVDDRIVLHPGANHPERQWPIKNWKELYEHLSKIHKVYIVCAPDTVDVIKKMSETIPNMNIFKGSLLEFSQWLSGAQLLIGSDSMAVHLAVAMGTPSLAIFGSQNPELTRPKGDMGSIIKPKNTCPHKRKHWRLCSKCMSSITPDDVYKKIESLLRCN
ncbi:MAG: glycosyltransferase family 9 protein [Candidatus Marinimicrobia bacterium]|nr:glycosyltransferase family 9 protein [Candidatus Neomarinimicrobiota bacterium]